MQISQKLSKAPLKNITDKDTTYSPQNKNSTTWEVGEEIKHLPDIDFLNGLCTKGQTISE